MSVSKGPGDPLTPALSFDPALHVYRVAGRPVLSVTQALSVVGLIDDEWFTEDHRTRGRFVHKAIMLDERHELREDTVDPRLAGYLEAYRSFVREARPGPCLLLEEPMLDTARRYAGTPDQVREIFGSLAVIDHKSGGPAPWHRLQTAAYAWLAGGHHNLPSEAQSVPLKRYALYLRRDGTYRLEQHMDRRDWKIFQAALTLASWKTNGDAA